ncbi:MAG: DUF4007 family protein [Cocleimonas sp.]|jgi:hypothetical protein
MALINNSKFPINKWWLSTGIKLLKTNPDIFSTGSQRLAMKEFIAGSTVVKSINGWMQSTQLSENSQKLSEFGLIIEDNDPHLSKSATWWAIHLQTVFSEKGEPYSTLFKNLDSFTKDWNLEDDLQERIRDAHQPVYASASVDTSYDGVRKSFFIDGPLEGLGLIDFRTHRDNVELKMGSPKVTDEIIIYALSLARFTFFKSRLSVDFNAIIDTGINNYLCLSKSDLKKSLQRMSQMNQWKDFFTFDLAADLESITFKESCIPRKTLILLLQQGEDTWL